MFVCFKCDSSFYIPNDYINHLRQQHIVNSLYKCNFDKKCDRMYDSLRSFRNHLKTHHTCSQPSNTPPIVTQDNTQNCIPYIDNSRIASTRSKNDEYKYIFLKFIVKLLCDDSIARKKAFSIIRDMHSQLSDIIKHMGQISQKYYSFYDESDLRSITEIIDYTSTQFEISEYKLFKELDGLGLFIKAIDYTLTTEGNIAYVNENPIFVETLYRTKIMPISSIFEKIFKTANFLVNLVPFVEKLKIPSEVCSNVIQSRLWKSRIEKLEQNETDCLFLPLLIYYDDFEPLNALGSKSGAYKIGAIYCKIMCLLPEWQAQNWSTHLIMLFFSDDRKKFGDTIVFTPLIKELNKLQEGFKIDSTSYKKCKIIPFLLCGDNLGLNSLLGFTESFNANFFCRFCKTSKQHSQSQITDNNVVWRDKQTYEADLLKNCLSETGIRENSVWNDLIGFHVTTNLSIDVMHDMLEGVCHYDITQIMQHFITKYKLFTLEQLNTRIKKHNFGPRNKNKIGQINEQMLKTKRLKCTASEMFSFIEHFSLIVGDYTIPEYGIYIFNFVIF